MLQRKMQGKIRVRIAVTVHGAVRKVIKSFRIGSAYHSNSIPYVISESRTVYF